MKKRIALGVVAALAGGLLAAAPASAAGTLALAGDTVVKTGSDLTLALSVSGVATSSTPVLGVFTKHGTASSVGANALVANETVADTSVEIDAPTTVGTYGVRIFADVDGSGALSSADAYADWTFTVGNATVNATNSSTALAEDTVVAGKTVTVTADPRAGA